MGFFNEILYTYTDEASTEVSINSYKKARIIGTSNTKIIIPPWLVAFSILEILIRTFSLDYQQREVGDRVRQNILTNSTL